MNSNIFVVIGLGYGDEGKGSIVDYLVRQYKAHTVVRFNGGPQAAHHVVTFEGITHCFAQFGSGTFVPGVKTYLSRYMLVDPLALEVENNVLKEKDIDDAVERLTIDENCLIVTPFHKIINRMLEISRGNARNGSCGMGVGQAMADGHQMKGEALFAGDLRNKSVTRKKLDFLWRIKLDLAEQLVEEHKENSHLLKHFDQIKRTGYVERLVEEYYDFVCSGVCISNEDYLNRLLNKDGNVVFEGAQGVLLDTEYGFWPHVTKTRTTFKNAGKLISDSGCSGNVVKIGVLRAYGTRHGVGPFVTEDDYLTTQIPDYHNSANEWQGVFRIGWFDLVLARYALDVVGGVNHIALTNTDRLSGLEKIKICTAYEYFDKKYGSLKQLLEISIDECKPIYCNIDIKKYIQFIEKKLNVPISIISNGPRAEDKINIMPQTIIN